MFQWKNADIGSVFGEDVDKFYAYFLAHTVKILVHMDNTFRNGNPHVIKPI